MFGGIVKMVRLYITAEIPPYQIGGTGRYIGILFYDNYLRRIYSGRLSCRSILDCVFYGVLRGKELLKYPVDILILTDISEVLDYIKIEKKYSAALQKIKKHPKKITWRKIDNNDLIGIFLQILRNRNNSL